MAVWLVSAVPASWAVTNFALGVWIDRLGDYRMITLGVGTVILAGVWSWWAARQGVFSSLLGSRLVAGVAVGVIWTASVNLIGGMELGVRPASILHDYYPGRCISKYECSTTAIPDKCLSALWCSQRADWSDLLSWVASRVIQL